MEVTFADGYIADVRRLGIFELDKIPKPDLGPYRYKLKVYGGEVLELEYDPFSFEEEGKEPPRKPNTPESEIKPDSPEAYAWRDWNRHEAALLHHELRLKAMHLYFEAIASYIIGHCLDKEAIIHLSEADWPLVYEIALVEPVTMDLIDRALRDTYEAEYAGKSIFDARKELPESESSYNVLRVWENQLANLLQLRDEELALMPADERARRIVAMKIDRWMESLELNSERKKRKQQEMENALKT